MRITEERWQKSNVTSCAGGQQKEGRKRVPGDLDLEFRPMYFWQPGKVSDFKDLFLFQVQYWENIFLTNSNAESCRDLTKVGV